MSTDTPASTIRLPDAAGAHAEHLAAGGATAWREPLEITSYDAGEPDRYPMFFEHRVYQGSSGRVYPLPFTDSVETESYARSWDAIHLENRWLRLVVLPELGGRIHIGYDKSADYDFFYRNNVIKPALVGLAGPWISGGVEFNWPQHHRPATYLPVDTEIEYGDDGSVTVWCSDHDPFNRMKGMHGIRLRPDSAVIELVARLHNRTSETETFLWWANVAARVHDNYQSFFPTDVQWVADHARRAITAFPEADRPYYGHDYPALAETGGDRLDFYRNIAVPTSYMVTGTQDDFFGGYDHDAQAGFVHWADRHVAPGKKLWTWGDAPFGHAWDRLLTDNDGPYIELMAGVFTDNQPDFTFIAPGETKTFSQYWFPIQSIGVVHQANLDCAVHLEATSTHGGATIVALGVATTAEQPAQQIRLLAADGAVLAEWTVRVAPGAPFVETVTVAGIVADTELTLEVVGLLSWTPRERVAQPEPETATEPPLPADIASVEELYTTGVHLAQYRHPTRSAADYWREAVRRDPDDVRSNIALARLAYDTADYESAHALVLGGMKRLTSRNSNPSSGEASYRLGQVLRRLGRPDSAYDAFAKAAWDAQWRHAAEFECARLDAVAGRDARAIEHAVRSLRLDADDLRTRALLVVVLRRAGRADEAAGILAASRALDPLDQLGRALAGEQLSADAATRIDVALDLASFGAGEHAAGILAEAAAMPATDAGNARPIALYLLAQLLDRLGAVERAAMVRAEARSADAVRSFPSLLDHHDALVAALAADPDDAQALSLLGMFLYHHRRHDAALDVWERALAAGPRSADAEATLLRNAAIGWYNRRGDEQRARDYYERALALRPGDARLWFESDQLLKRLGMPAAERLARLPFAATARDDLAVEYAELLTELGRPEQALDLLESRPFSPWEGGEGRSLAAWDLARSVLGLPLATPPASLGEGRPAVQAPQAVTESGAIDYFATSLPDLLLFNRIQD